MKTKTAENLKRKFQRVLSFKTLTYAEIVKIINQVQAEEKVT